MRYEGVSCFLITDGVSWLAVTSDHINQQGDSNSRVRSARTASDITSSMCFREKSKTQICSGVVMHFKNMNGIEHRY